MYLEQICPGQVNPGYHALGTFTWNAVRYIVYASGYKVILFADPAILVQQINVPAILFQENSSAVTAVAGNTRTGQLAVAYGELVAIFEAYVDEKIDQCSWKLDDTIKLDTAANCLDWSKNGSLLIAGHNISVWRPRESRPKFEKIWQIRPATDIIMAKFEPHSDMFVTAGKNDHLVTLWYKPNADSKYTFLYLHHPRPVTHFVWRKLYGSKRPDCALFTMARDGIGRFWRPIDSEKPHMLHMCAVIDPSQSLVTADPSSSENGSAHIREYHSDDFTPIHYIGCDEIGSSIYTQFRHHSRNDRLDHRLHRVRDMIRDTPDLLFRIQPDGSLTLWGVQHLDMIPRRIPRVFVVLRVAQAINITDVPFFLNSVNVLHDFGHIQSASIIKPAELSLITRNSEGQLRCYGLNLVDFLDTTCFSPRLHFKYSWLGHKYPIKTVKRSQKGHLCTIGSDGLVNVWKYGSIQARSRLHNISSLASKSPSILAVPLEQDRHVAVYDGNQMRVYHCEEGECCMNDYIVCEGGSNTLTSLHTYNVDASSGKLYYLLGISKSTKQVYTWQLITENDTVLRAAYRGSQQFDWREAPSAICIADQWFSNTASAALYNLASTSDGVVSAAVALGSKVVCYDIQFQSDEESLQWKELFTFDLEMNNIQNVRFTHNAIAVVSENTLSILSSIQSNHPPSMHKKLQFDSNIVDIAWNLSSDGQYLLAVALSNTIAIYGEKRGTNPMEDLNQWIPYTEFDVQSLEDVTGICWMDYGVLAVAAGSDLRCYLKWLTPEDRLYEKPALDLQMEPMSNIYDLSYELDGALPLYHPNHLIHYLMWGKIDLINAVLLSLYRFLKRIVDDEHVVVGRIPPLSLSAILKLQEEEEASKPVTQRYDALFDESQIVEDDDENDSRPLAASETEYLTDCLKRRELPALAEKERLHLVAMVDTFVEISHQREALDENGARFTALIENHYHLKAILPKEYRSELMPCDLVWALHSQSQDLLLERCIRLCGGKLLWKDARDLGIFLWLQKQDAVIEQMTSIARNTYLAKEVKDPVDCTLYYLALRKKTLLQTLWRSASHHKEQNAMLKFLANDFTQARWQTAAAKNAFVLLGKQRYEYAAAFFLLADKLKDAVNVILKNLKDYQLAIAICRVYEGDSSPLLKEILQNTVLPQAIESKDRWLISISYWLLDDPKEAVRSLIVPFSDIENGSQEVSDSAASVTDPNLFILYEDLKRRGRHHKQKDIRVDQKLEYTFSLNVSRAYQQLGCPMLALHILTHFKPKRAAMIGLTNGTGPSAENADLFAEMNEPKEHKAVDLFADEPQVHRAADLFSDEPQMHRAADLFADEPAQTLRAADLFADESQQTHRAIDLFADEPQTSHAIDLVADSSKTGESSDLFASETQISENTPGHVMEDEPVEEDKSLAVYKGLLVIRLLQTVFHTASAIYDSSLAKDNVYRDVVARRKQDLISLGETVHIQRKTLEKLLMEKSIEADVFGLYLRIQSDTHDQDGLFWAAFKNGCLQVFDMSLSQQEFNFSNLVFIENWAERVLTTFNLWSAMQGKNVSTLEAQELLLYAYVSLLLVTLKQRHLEKAWNLLTNMRSFLDTLSSLKDTEEIVQKALSTEVKMQTNADSDEFEAFSDNDSLFGYNMEEEVYRPHVDFKDKTPGANLLENASLHYTLSQLEGYMQSSEKNTALSTDLIQFIWTFILDAIAYRAYRLKVTCIQQLGNDINGRTVAKQFKTLRQKKYWRSLKTLRVPERLLPFVNFSLPEINVFSSDEMEQQQPQLVYSTPTTVHAFAINSENPDTVAVCMKTEIQEVDLTSSRPYGPPPTGGSVFPDNHSQSRSYHQHPDSNPDTEEEDETGFSDAETEASGHTGKHPLLHHHKSHQHLYAHVHGKTPLASSPASGRVHPEEHSKVQQNLNIDILHESLRRSLGIKKEGSLASDSSRSPAAASSSDSMAEMVTLKRSISATCAEAHPHFPFYITGCEISSSTSPSAILWQYGQDREIAKYYGCRGKATRIHFEPFGQKFGAGDTNGGLAFWRFDSHAHSDRPYYTLQSCHSKATRDFAFLDSSSLVSTAGTSNAMSRKRDHVCVWDTLLPPSKAMIFSLSAHDAGAYAIAYDSNRKLLLTGGKRGEIAVSDLRQRAVLHTFNAHQSRIRSIAIDSENSTIVTGSVDGDLKIWDLRTYKQQASYDTQPRNRFLGSGFQHFPLKAYGVTQIQIVEKYLYSAGPAGLVRCSTTASRSSAKPT